MWRCLMCIEVLNIQHCTDNLARFRYIVQSLEYVAETRILAEMKIENCGETNILRGGKKLTNILFFM